LPTHVIGSHGFPGWFWTALDKVKAGDYGQTDVKETFDDATQLAIRDQERAGVDIVCDGEMRRFFFVQSFYGRMEGLEELEPLRKTGLYAYDSVPRYRPTAKIKISQGLGLVDDFKYLKTQTDRPVKATCPGPVTLSIHVQTRPGDAYNNDRLALCWDLVPAVNAELKALAAAGADYIQVDEPSACARRSPTTSASATCSPAPAASGRTGGCSRPCERCAASSSSSSTPTARWPRSTTGRSWASTARWPAAWWT
jgi:5-methyltetrahydropteroyltriglutamate--homocysteine methyltransferase